MPENENISRGSLDIHDEYMDKVEPKGENYIFAIGIDEYAHDYWVNLHNPVKEVDVFVDIMTRRYQFESGKSLIKKLINKEATKDNIDIEFRKLIKLLNTDDTLIIYFSGHGGYHEHNKRSSWIPYDAGKSGINWIPDYEVIHDYLNKISALHIVLIVDTCFGGNIIRKTNYKDVIEFPEKFEEEKEPSRFFLSSGGIEPVSDGEQGCKSPFARELCKLLRQNNEPKLGISALSKRLEELTKKGEQRMIGQPMNITADYMRKGEFYFELNSFNREKIALQKAKEAKTLYAINQFIKSHPEGTFIKEAKRIKADRNQWEETKRAKNIKSYEKYLKCFPKGEKQGKAKAKIKSIKKIIKENKEQWKRYNEEVIMRYIEYANYFSDKKVNFPLNKQRRIQDILDEFPKFYKKKLDRLGLGIKLDFPVYEMIGILVENNEDISSFSVGKAPISCKLYTHYMLEEREEREKGKLYEKYISKKSLNPVVEINWSDAKYFANWLSCRENLDPCYDQNAFIEGKNGYRLPTQKEWEEIKKQKDILPEDFKWPTKIMEWSNDEKEIEKEEENNKPTIKKKQGGRSPQIKVDKIFEIIMIESTFSFPTEKLETFTKDISFRLVRDTQST